MKEQESLSADAAAVAFAEQGSQSVPASGFDWRSWLCFVFTDNSLETQALSDESLRALICGIADARQLTWNEIASAPKDGTRVLTYCATTSFPHQRFDLMHYGGRWRSICPGMACQPTHWMRLPDAPQVGCATDSNERSESSAGIQSEAQK